VFFLSAGIIIFNSKNFEPKLHRYAHDLAKQTSCEQTDQCFLVGLGQAGCGGPDYYLPYGIHGNGSSILPTLGKITEFFGKLNIEPGVAYICIPAQRLPLICESGQCLSVDDLPLTKKNEILALYTRAGDSYLKEKYTECVSYFSKLHKQITFYGNSKATESFCLNAEKLGR